MKKSPIIHFSVLLQMLAGGAILSAETPILNESFQEGERLTQDLPSTSAWYVSNTEVLTYSPGLTMATDGASHQVVTYFTDSGTVDLDVGERLEIRFDFQVAGALNAGAGIRIGLFDSQFSRVWGDTVGISDAAYNAYSGYGAWFNPNAPNPGGISIRERTGINNNLLGFATPWTARQSGGPELFLEDATTYTGLLVADRIDSEEVAVSFSVAGGALTEPATVSWSDDTAPLTGFDTFAFYQNLAAGDSFSLTDVAIRVVSVERVQVTLERSSDLQSWVPLDITRQLVTSDGKLLFDADEDSEFFRLRIESHNP